MSLIPSDRNNPCPICEVTGGKCRQGREDEKYWQCMTYANAKKGEIVNQYKCIGHTRDRLWAQFRLDNSQEWSEQQRLEWQRENQRRQRDKARVDDERQRRSLSANQRHEQYTKLLAELTLHPQDRADLLRRGFTHEQIELSNFKSVGRYHQLQSRYNELLPGITRGDRLVVRDAGYLCPVRNADGLLVGCQVRLRTLPTTETNRYRWLSGEGQTLHLFPEGCKPEGELPLSVHIPQKLNKIAIGICEGTGAKPFLASQKLGIPFIGAAGGQHASSPQIFKSSLQQIEEALWRVVQEIGLSSTGKTQPENQKELQSSANKDSQFKIEQKYQKQSLNTGTELDRLVTKSRSSCLTSNSSQWLKRKLSDSLAATLNSTDSKCNPLEILSCQPAESQSQFQVELVITPDSGDIINRSVMTRWQRVIALLNEWGWSVQVAWWGQLDKSHPDIDELTDYSSIEYLTPSEFWEIGRKHGSLPKEGFAKGIKQQQLEIELAQAKEHQHQFKQSYPERAKAAWRKARRFTADIQKATQWFEADLPPENSMFFGRAGLGRGKSSQLVIWVKLWKLLSKGFICLGYRNTLLLQLCEKLGFYHLHESDSAIMQRDPSSGIALCIDSLWRFKPEDFDGKILILDEVMSVIRHLLHSPTVKGRDNILELFHQALQRASQVVCLDGNLADWAVKYLHELAPEKKIIRLENTFQGNKPLLNYLLGTVDIDEEVRKNDRSPWLYHLLNESQVPAICADSQVFAESLDNLLTEKGLKVLRIDSKTVPEEYIKECLKDCDAYIEQHQPDAIIYTPSAESGVDVSIKGYFTHHYGFFFGVLGVDAILQMLGRIRDSQCTKFVWVREWVAQSEQTHSRSPFAKSVGKAIEQVLHQDIIDTVTDINRDKEVIAKILKIVEQSKNSHFEASNQIQAISNYEKGNLRECVLEALREAGYTVACCTLNPNEDSKILVKKATEATKRQNCHDIFTAEKIDVDYAEDLSKSTDCNWEDRVKVINALYRKRLPGIDESDSWTEDFIYKVKYENPDFINQQEIFWLFKHPDESNRMNLEKYYRLAQRESTFIGNIRSRAAKVKALRDIGIEYFITPNNAWHEDSPELVELVNRCKDEKVAAALGKHPGQQKNIRFLGILLKILGLKHTGQKVRSEDGDYRIYQLDLETLNDPDRLNALQCLDTRWANYLTKEVEILNWDSVLDYQEATTIENTTCQQEGGHSQQVKQAQTLTHQALDPVPGTPQNYIYNIEGFVEQEKSHDVVCDEVAQLPLPTPVDALKFALENCQSVNQFIALTEGYSPEIIEAAIALSDFQPRRRQLTEWWGTSQDCRVLRSVSSWSEIQLSQDCLNSAWEALEQTERDRLHSLYLYLQSASPPLPTSIEMPPELVEGVQVKINLANVKPKAREVRADEEGMVGILEVAEPHRNCYKVRCEDGILRIYGLEYLEIVDDQKPPLTQSQQAIQLGGQSPGYIDRKSDCPPNVEEVSQGVADPVDSVESLLITLPLCENIDQFAALVESHSTEVVEKAIALADTAPRRRQLEAWYQQLAQQFVGSGAGLAHDEAIANPPLESYAEGDEVWAYFPQSEAKWLRATVEWVRDRMVRVKSGFLGKLIEREDAIAPGHWQLSG